MKSSASMMLSTSAWNVPPSVMNSSTSCHQLSANRQEAMEGSPAKLPPWLPGAEPNVTHGAPPTEGAEPGDLYERLLQKSHRLRESMVRSLLSSEDVWEGVEQRGRDLEWEEEDYRVSREQG